MAIVNPGQKRYPSELKERATKMVLDLRAQDPNDVNVISRVTRQLGVGSESLRIWVKQSEVEAGKRPGLTTEEREELKRLSKENRELQRVNDILMLAPLSSWRASCWTHYFCNTTKRERHGSTPIRWKHWDSSTRPARTNHLKLSFTSLVRGKVFCQFH
jgi:transposase